MENRTRLSAYLVINILVISALACQLGSLGGQAPQTPSATITANAADAVMPGIVISSDLSQQQDAFVSLYQAVSQGVVSLQLITPIGPKQGSGFVIDTEGHYDYPYLGITSRSDLSLADAQELGLDRTDGALITRVSENGPADKAGLQAGDFIIAIDGFPVKSFDEMISYLFKHKIPEETVELTIIRDREELIIDLVLGARP